MKRLWTDLKLYSITLCIVSVLLIACQIRHMRHQCLPEIEEGTTLKLVHGCTFEDESTAERCLVDDEGRWYVLD